MRASSGPGDRTRNCTSDGFVFTGIPPGLGGAKKYAMIRLDRFAMAIASIIAGQVARPFQSSSRWLTAQKVTRVDTNEFVKPKKKYRELLESTSTASPNDII